MKFKELVKDLRSYNISMHDADHAADWLEAYEAVGEAANEAVLLFTGSRVGGAISVEIMLRKALARLADLEATPALPGGSNATIT